MSDSTPGVDHYTAEDQGKVGTIGTVEEARAAHHLATADPEIDGKMTGPAHEKLYNLDRAENSAALWRAAGVHEIENRALQGDEEGGRVAGIPDAETAVDTADEEKAVTPADTRSTTAAPKPAETTTAS